MKMAPQVDFYVGDIPVTPYDNQYAIKQIEEGHKSLLHRPTFSSLSNDSITGEPLVPISLDGKHHPRIITLGGDHTIVLPILRSIYSAYGSVSVIHFDRQDILHTSYFVDLQLICFVNLLVIWIHGSRQSLAAHLLPKPPSTMELISIGPVRRD
jgi:hypothetical protein